MALIQDVCIFDEKEWKVLVDELALSPRQGEIVHHLFAGRSDKQIAHEMNLALPTVRTHLGRLFAKLNVQDRHELILYIFRQFRYDCKVNNNHHNHHNEHK